MFCTFGVFKLSNLPRKALTFQVPAKGPTVGRSRHCRQGSRFVMGCTVDSLVVTGTVVNSEPTLEHLMGSGIVTVHPLEYHIQTCVQDISRLSKAFRDFSETFQRLWNAVICQPNSPLWSSWAARAQMSPERASSSQDATYQFCSAWTIEPFAEQSWRDAKYLNSIFSDFNWCHLSCS